MGKSKITTEERKERNEARHNKQPARVNQELYDQAVLTMTPEQLAMYEEIGEKMYNTVDFNTSTVLDNPDDPLAESIAYVSEAVKAGLHPVYLTNEELKVMEEGMGADWFTKFGYDSITF